jgi:hypothetical protein
MGVCTLADTHANPCTYGYFTNATDIIAGVHPQLHHGHRDKRSESIINQSIILFKLITSKISNA